MHLWRITGRAATVALCLGSLALANGSTRTMPTHPSPASAGSQTAPQAQRPEVKWNNPDRPSIPGVEHAVLHSSSMDRDMGYNVYLPPGYSDGTPRYPVVYFLHGAGGNENSDAGGFAGLIQKETAAKQIPPVICVFPNGGMSGYMDHPDQKVMVMVETFLIQELIPKIDATYRTVASRAGRTLCGFSMGGGGAIRLAVKHPDLFSAAASWAAALHSRDAANDPAALAKENAEKIKGRVRLLLIVGDKDMTYAGHAPFIQALMDLKIPFDYRVLPGLDHNLGAYYEQTGADLVRFVTAGFAAPSTPNKP